MRTVYKALLVLAVVGVFAAQQAEAGWRHRGYGGGWGSSGGYGYGSSGGWGSSGGYGYGSSGGWGSRGGWGSSGGYAGYGSSGGYGYGSSGGWGSSGGYGSSGGSNGGGYRNVTPTPSTPAPAPATPPAPSDAVPPPVPGPTTFHPTYGPLRSGALLSVKVPENAKVFVNDHETTSTGSDREFVSRDLQPGARYNYDVRVEFDRDGKPISEVKSIELTAGQTANLDFTQAEPAQQAAIDASSPTTLIVRVPDDAKLYLAGRETKATGPVREFTTKKLPAGSEWASYAVRAVIERDGQQVVREQNVSLKAGESREISFDFNNDVTDRVADSSAR